MSFLALPVSQFILFQMQWWSALLLAKSGYPNTGALIAISLCLLEYVLLKFSKHRLKLVFFCLILGILMDSVLSYHEIFIYKYYIPGIDWLIPLWGIAIWVSFSTWFSLSLYLRNYKLLVSIATIIFAPLSYLVGNHFSVVELKYQEFSLFIIGVTWLIFMNLILRWPKVSNE